MCILFVGRVISTIVLLLQVKAELSNQKVWKTIHNSKLHEITFILLLCKLLGMSQTFYISELSYFPTFPAIKI